MSNPKVITKKSFFIHAVGFLALILLGLVFLNYIFSQVVSARWDLTSDHQFTLSSATENLVQKLPHTVHIKVFLSKDLPAPENTLEQNLKDLLEEFQSASHGKIKFEILHPQTPVEEESAKGYGLRKVAVSQRDESQRSLKFVFKGMTLIYLDKAETIPEIRSTDNIEYLIAKSILNLTSPEQKKVGILTGFGGLAESQILRDSMAEVFDEVFGKRIIVEPSKISESCELNPRPDALVILNITVPLTECAQYAIEQAVFSGTSLALLQSPTQGDYNQPDQPRINFDPKLNPIISDIGIKFNSDLLLDRVHNLVGTQFTEDNQVDVSLPALPVITDLDKSHPITQNLSAIVLPFSGTVSIDEEQARLRKAQIDRLAVSSSDSVTRPSGGDIQVDALQTPKSYEIPGPHALALAIQTNQVSSFTQNFPEKSPRDKFIPSTEHARYLIIPNGEFLFSNKIIGYTDEFARFGIHLFVNGIEWLVQDESLIEIRNRALPQMIQKPDKKVQNRILWINIVGVPGLVVLIMIGIRLFRKRRQTQIAKHFSELSDAQTKEDKT